MAFGYQVLGFGSGGEAPLYIAACGGTISYDGNYKIHKFTGDGTLTVTAVGNDVGSNKVSYMVVAGGAGGTWDRGGGGGAGGYREGKSPQCNYTESPKACTSGCNAGLPVSCSPGSYAIVVGGGGAAGSPSAELLKLGNSA